VFVFQDVPSDEEETESEVSQEPTKLNAKVGASQLHLFMILGITRTAAKFENKRSFRYNTKVYKEQQEPFRKQATGGLTWGMTGLITQCH